MAARKIIYTNQHIGNNLNVENWYKVITDFIEYAIISFGKMPVDCGEPLYLRAFVNQIIHCVEESKDASTEQKNKILEFIKSYTSPENQQKTDLNILIRTYEKWFTIFPFALNSYFGNLKQHFEKELPIYATDPEINIYSGLTKRKLHTKSSLIESLVNLTNDLLTQINGVTLYENGFITDANKIKLELVINSRKLKLKQGYKNTSHDEEQRYRKILKEWFTDEKKFIDELTPLLNIPLSKQPETEDDQMKLTITAYALMHVYLAMYGGQAVTQQNKNQLARKYGYNSGDQLRNDFTLYQNEDKRMDISTTNKRSANTHLKRLEDILPLLQKENTDAFDKAHADYLELKKI